MTLRQYLIIMSFATVLCWVAWGFVITNVDPFETSVVAYAFFYLSLFFSLLGTIAMGAFSYYHFFSSDDLPMFRYVQKSFRDALIWSTVLIVLLFLQAQGLLRFWNVLIFIAFLAVFILFHYSTRKESGFTHNL